MLVSLIRRPLRPWRQRSAAHRAIAAASVIVVAALGAGTASVAHAATSSTHGSAGHTLRGHAVPADVVDPPGTVTVTPDANSVDQSTERDLVEPLAGSPSTLIYAQGAELASDDNSHGATPNDPTTERLYARSVSGTVTDLGVPPTGLYPNMSLVNGILTGIAASQPGTPETVYYWNLGNGTSGSPVLPSADDYWLSSSLDGFIYGDGHSLYDESLAGTVTSLGSPFTSRTPGDAVADDNGVMLYGGPGDQGFADHAYMSFTDPGQYTPVDFGTSTREVDCSAIDVAYAGCVKYTKDGEEPAAVVLVPTDGGAATTVPPGPEGNGHGIGGIGPMVAISGSTLIWQQGGLQSTSVADPTLHLGTRGGDAPPSATISGVDPFHSLHADSDAMASAYGDAVLTNHAGHHLLTATDATHTSQLLMIPRSPVAAADFDLSQSNLVYTDDDRFDTDGVATESATVDTNAGSFSVGTPSLVCSNTGSKQVAISGTVTVYAVPQGPTHVHLKVLGPEGKHSIKGINKDTQVQASGDRVLYEPSSHGNRSYAVYNANSGKTKPLDIPVLPGHPALGGKHLAFLKDNGSVWRLNLKSGKQIKVSPADHQVSAGTLFIHDNYAGWSLDDGTTRAPHMTNAYGDASATTPIVTLDHPLYGLSTLGAVLSSDDIAAADFDGGITASFSLQTYDGRTEQLLPEQSFVAPPQLAHNAMAWIDAHGDLKMAPVSAPTAAARH
jgi:hypothetical protein